MVTNPRYDGHPLKRLLEFYVLKAIGELSQTDEDRLIRLAPKLQGTFGGGGQWHEAIEAAVHMETETASEIRGMWERNLEVARANGVKLTPQQFAEMVVDDNFGPF